MYHHGPLLCIKLGLLSSKLRCNNSYLDLNVTKTKEMIVDFIKQGHSPENIFIHDKEVEIVNKYEYLGTIFGNKLEWDDNTKGRS